MIDIQCSGCGKRYRVPEAFGGKKTRCKQCSAVIAIPELVLPPAMEDDPIAIVESAPEPAPPPAPVEPEPEAPAKPARKPMKLPARGPAAGGAKKPHSRPAFQARKPLGKPAAAPKPIGARRTRVAAPDAEEGHEVVAEKGGQRSKALLVGGILVIVLLGCAAGWYFLAGPGAASTTPAAKVPKPKADVAKETATAPAAEVKLAGADEGAAKVARLPGAPLDPLSCISKDVHFVGQIGVGQIANIPGARDGIQKQIESSGLKEFFADADLDPTGQIARAWIAGEIPASALEGAPAKSDAGEDDTAVIVIEGTFDRSKLVNALEKHSLAKKEEKKAGDLDVYQLMGDTKAPRLVLPSDEQIILGIGAPFESALELLAGKGSSVRENAALAARAKDFESSSMVWLAFHLPGALRDKMPGKVEGAFLSIDRSPEGAILLAAHADCASPQDAAKAKQEILKPLDFLQPMLPPPAAEALKSAEVEVEGKTVSVSLEIPAEVLEKLETGTAEAASGEGEEAPPEDAEAGDDAEPEEKGDAEMKEGEEAKESEEAAEPEAETEAEAEPEPDSKAKAKAEEEEPAAEESGAETEEKSGEE